MAYNEYDDPHFFEEYAKMGRSQGGLPAAGEWHQLQPLFPPLEGKAVLDLGCGYGWHCKYAAEQGAAEVLGIDLSHRMIAEAEQRNTDSRITYRVCGIEEYEYPAESGTAWSPTWLCITSQTLMRYTGRCAIRCGRAGCFCSISSTRCSLPGPARTGSMMRPASPSTGR